MSANKVGFLQNNVSISVITATFNAVDVLPRLIESLESQTDQEFEWIVADGGSTDGTCDLINRQDTINTTLSSQADFGIYDAINRAIKLSSSQYYLIVGADDFLFPEAIKNFKTHVSAGADIIAANIQFKDKILKPGRGNSFLFGQYEYVAGHAVGTLFKRSLHEKFGYYSKHFPIAADQLFIKQCCQAGANIVTADFIAGTFDHHGISAQDSLGTLSESFRVQLITEKSKFLQVLIYICRLIKNYSKL